jgi:hypothetical protein
MVAQGCPLKRFLHVPQEAAGGYNRGGSKLVLPGNAPPSFFSCPLRLHQLKLLFDPDKSVMAHLSESRFSPIFTIFLRIAAILVGGKIVKMQL